VNDQTEQSETGVESPTDDRDAGLLQFECDSFLLGSGAEVRSSPSATPLFLRAWPNFTNRYRFGGRPLLRAPEKQDETFLLWKHRPKPITARSSTCSINWRYLGPDYFQAALPRQGSELPVLALRNLNPHFLDPSHFFSSGVGLLHFCLVWDQLLADRNGPWTRRAIARNIQRGQAYV